MPRCWACSALRGSSPGAEPHGWAMPQARSLSLRMSPRDEYLHLICGRAVFRPGHRDDADLFATVLRDADTETHDLKSKGFRLHQAHMLAFSERGFRHVKAMKVLFDLQQS